MQVERQHSQACLVGGEWRTGEEYVGICPVVGDNVGKLTLIPHTTCTEGCEVKAGDPAMGLARWDEPTSD